MAVHFNSFLNHWVHLFLSVMVSAVVAYSAVLPMTESVTGTAEFPSARHIRHAPAVPAVKTHGFNGTLPFGLGQMSPGYIHAFIASLSVIIVSELGDKTFFIAAILAMRHSRLVVFGGAMSSLFFMHILAALFGYLATVIPRAVTYYLSSFLFFIFGVKMLKDGWYMSPDEGQEEYEEAQAELRKQEAFESTIDTETGVIRPSISQQSLLTRLLRVVCSRVFLQSFTMTMVAEWGDRSQITTIILAARENLYGVILGGGLGHFICTGIAVLGGRFVAQHISVRTVTLIGGVVFLGFAASALVIGP